MEFTLRRPGEPSLAPLRVALAILAGLVLLVLVAAAALSVAYDGKILPGVRVAGVPLGGLTPEAAGARLDERFAELGAVRAELRAEDLLWRPSLAELGVALEPAPATRDAYAVGRLSGPVERLLVLTRSPFESVDLSPGAVPRQLVAAWVDGAARDLDRPAADARFEILPTGELRSTPEQAGRRLDRAVATDEIVAALEGWVAALPRDGQRQVALTLPTESVAPRVLAAELAPTRLEAERVLGRATTLRIDEYERRLERQTVAALLTVTRDGSVAKLDLDSARVAALVTDLAALTDRAPVDARLSIAPDGRVDLAPDRPGRRLDGPAAAEQLRAVILGSGTAELALPTEQIPARVRAADLAAARATADRLLAGPTEVTAGDTTLAYAPTEIAPLLSVEGLRLTVDGQQVEAGARVIAQRAERAPRNARLRIVGRDLEPIEEGVDGQRVDVAAATATITAALARGERQIALPVQTLPALKSSDRAAFGPLEQIESASTTYAGGVPERTHNVELAASLLNGLVVPPGLTFSFNAALGPTTVENGFQWAWGIEGGGAGGAPRTVPSVGGGICQVATTLFQAVFWSGYQLEERSWHLYWIPRYGTPPRGLPGLDATVDYDSDTDLKWTNNTEAPVLIQASTDGAAITFSLHGQRPRWQVDVSPPQITNPVPARGGVVRETTAALPAGRAVAVEEARDGFTARIVRTVTAPGVDPRVLDMVSTYQPSRNVILVGVGR